MELILKGWWGYYLKVDGVLFKGSYGYWLNVDGYYLKIDGITI